MKRPLAREKCMDVYSYIVKCMSEKGVIPTVREIGSATGIPSTSTVYTVLGLLEKDGLIERDLKHSRSIRLVGDRGAAKVPVLGKVTAGKPILALQEVRGFIPFASNYTSDGLFGLIVSGLSMKNAGILDGDIVIADKNAVVVDGDIVIGMDGDEATVKRLAHENGKVVFLPENEDFSPIYPEEPSVLGKVIGCYREY